MTFFRTSLTKSAFYLATLLTFALSGPAFAQEQNSRSDWNNRFTVYLWGANITANTPGSDNAPIPFYKLLDNLKMGFMGDFQARRGNWTFGVDVLYMDLKDSKNESVNLPGEGPVTIGGAVELTAWVVTPTVGYALVDSDKARFEILGGLRYLDLGVKARLGANNEPLLDAKRSGSDWDAIIGARSTINLNEKWYIPLYGDVGTGDSKSTWQLLAGIGYRFKKVDATLAYRYLKYTFDNDELLDDMILKGPALGVSLYF